MGKMLGSFDGDNELDRPDLNKCPDCECYFAQDCCPLCGKECPPEMRAGVRKTVKKRRTRSSSGRVTFMEWYHSWWFIILMLIFFPLIGIVLLVTSPHKRSHKLILVGVGAAYMIVSSIGLGNIAALLTDTFDPPVNTKLSREEYIEKCVLVDVEDYYREPDKYKGQYIKLVLTVTSNAMVDYGSNYGDEYSIVYSCKGGASPILIRDCSQDSRKNLMPNDLITIFGEAVGNYELFTDQGSMFCPCVNVAYIELAAVDDSVSDNSAI